MVAAEEMVTGVISDAQTLVDLPVGREAMVVAVDAHIGGHNGQGMVRRLAEIGFLPGETLRVIARVPGGDPIAIRIGNSTFALRRHEAVVIRVRTVGQ